MEQNTNPCLAAKKTKHVVEFELLLFFDLFQFGNK